MLARRSSALVGPRSIRARPRSRRSRALGFSPDDVRHIVVTHLDLDHAGGLADFPRREGPPPRARARRRDGAHARSRSASATSPRTGRTARSGRSTPRTATPGAACRRSRGCAALDADIGLLPMHGHTRGHSADHRRTTAIAGSSTPATRTSTATPSRATRACRVGFAAFERATQMDSGARRASVAALRQLRDELQRPRSVLRARRARVRGARVLALLPTSVRNVNVPAASGTLPAPTACRSSRPSSCPSPDRRSGRTRSSPVSPGRPLRAVEGLRRRRASPVIETARVVPSTCTSTCALLASKPKFAASRHREHARADHRAARGDRRVDDHRSRASCTCSAAASTATCRSAA